MGWRSCGSARSPARRPDPKLRDEDGGDVPQHQVAMRHAASSEPEREVQPSLHELM